LPSAKTTSLGYGSPRNTTTSLSPSSASLSQVLLPWSCRFAISSVRSHMLVGAIGLRLLLGVGVAVVLAPVHGEELGAVGGGARLLDVEVAAGVEDLLDLPAPEEPGQPQERVGLLGRGG